MAKMNWGIRFCNGAIEGGGPVWIDTGRSAFLDRPTGRRIARSPDTRWSVSWQEGAGGWRSKKFHEEKSAWEHASAQANHTRRLVILRAPPAEGSGREWNVYPT